MPVGRITYGHLEPMTFAAFLAATGEDRLLKAIRACTPGAGVPEVLHLHVLELVRTYVPTVKLSEPTARAMTWPRVR
jgi:hypothetical protein